MPTTGAVNTPIYLSSTFEQDAVGVDRGLRVRPLRQPQPGQPRSPPGPARRSRTSDSPSPAAWRPRTPSCACSIPETTSSCPPTATAEPTAWRPVVHRRAGLAVDASGSGRLARRGVRPETRMVWVETPTNPLLDIVDIAAVAAVAHARGALVVVDNTFATPWLQQPLALGADIVVHSTTKYLGGHSDVVGGFAATNDPELRRASSGSSRTPPGRCRAPSTASWCSAASRPCRSGWSATAPTPWPWSTLLAAHPAVATVLHPSLPEHPGHERRPPADDGRSAAWSASPCAAASRPPSNVCQPHPDLHAWPRASAASRA